MISDAYEVGIYDTMTYTLPKEVCSISRLRNTDIVWNIHEDRRLPQNVGIQSYIQIVYKPKTQYTICVAKGAPCSSCLTFQ